MLDMLECSLRQFYVEHPEEDEVEIRRMAAGKLGLPYLNDFQTKFTRIPVARKRSILQQHKEDMPAILSGYQEITNGPPSSLQALVDQTNAYNANEKKTLPFREDILSKALANLRSYSNWLLAEFDVRMMHVYAIDDSSNNMSIDVGKPLESRISEKLGVCPEEYVHMLVIATGVKIRAFLLKMPSPSSVSSVPVSVPVPVSVSASSACQINPTSSPEHAGGETGCLQLRNWPGFKGDVSKTGTYRLQNLSVRHLNDIKDRLDAGVIIINAE
ncbi:hypothetical protein BD560DRAFT_437380 [Blakeslea trispora]|nr:hypothetical protein BD560DRAFT_437380 [Blakeslea trispora]